MRRPASLAVVLSLAACSAAPSIPVPAPAELDVAEEVVLTEPTASAGDRFGTAVALAGDGSRALVGNIFARNDSGSARVFVRSGASWTSEALLVSPDGLEREYFGASVALSQDATRALVGVPGGDVMGRQVGHARVFLRTGSTWAEEAMLASVSAPAGSGVGGSVALSADGTRAILGAAAEGQGAAHVFVRTGTTWAEEATLTWVDGLASTGFGRAVTLSGDGTRALVGRGELAEGLSAELFVRSGSTWTHEASLRPMGGSRDAQWGRNVALSFDGSVALVSADFDTTPAGQGAGSVRSFTRSGTTWTEEATLLASHAGQDRFGSGLAMTPDASWALIGARAADTTIGMQQGSVHVFHRVAGAWREEGALERTRIAAPLDGFGDAVAITDDGGRALVGAAEDRLDVTGGSARVYTLVPGPDLGLPCVSDAQCTSGFCTDAVCCTMRCDGAGMACAAAATGASDGTCALDRTAGADAATPASEAGVAVDGGRHAIDAGASATGASRGCGCRAGAGDARGAAVTIAAILAVALDRRRRRPTV